MGNVAYVREDTKGEADRPITFCFNGGPGVSSEWVHMGFLGPRILELDEAGRPLTLPPKIKDNENSILDVTDLVVIDPVGTGFSKACGESKDEDFWTYERDIESVGEFIRLYLARNARWGSPKYVAGESYGTVRAVGLCDYLNSKYGMGLNGLMLVSSIQDFSTDSDIETDLARVLSLPTYVADAWYHGRSSQEYLEKPLEEVMEEARAFAGGEYLSALFRGRSLPEEERTGHGGKAL